jgi:predicted nucleic acid-binding protein
MPCLLDADWVIQALANRPHAVLTINRLAAQRIAISIVTVAEIYEGAFGSANPEARLISYRGFLSRFRVLPLIDSIVERFAEIRAFLRHRGIHIPDFDIMVGATALHYDLTVLTYNVRHLERIPNLRIYGPR